MKIINGSQTFATIFTTNNLENSIDDYAVHQIQALCNNEANAGSKICVMPDVHPGKVGTIGLTMTVGDKIIPNVAGIDTGCGITLAKLKNKKLEFQKLDAVIRDNIPSGFTIRKKIHRFANEFDFSELHCYHNINEEKALLSLGTLGGGNHFIEVDTDEEGYSYIVIHSGSRHLGKEVTEYYIDEGYKLLKAAGSDIPHPLTYLEGELMEHYIHDLQIVQDFAALNREIILDELIKGMKLKVTASNSCIHNYIELIRNSDGTTTKMLRKGAISAKKNETVMIPVNMRDGVILGTGLGNEKWNFSAPHGAGRIMKREDVKNNFTVSAFKSEMKGIYSSCIGKDTLDEAPFAYRSLSDIQDVIQDTVTIDKIILPVYNFKAGGNS